MIHDPNSLESLYSLLLEGKEDETKKVEPAPEPKKTIEGWNQVTATALDFIRFIYDNCDWNQPANEITKWILRVIENPISGTVNRTDFQANKSYRAVVREIVLDADTIKRMTVELSRLDTPQSIRKWISGLLIHYTNNARNSVNTKKYSSKFSQDTLARKEEQGRTSNEREDTLRSKFGSADDIQRVKLKTETLHAISRTIKEILPITVSAGPDAVWEALTRTRDVLFGNHVINSRGEPFKPDRKLVAMVLGVIGRTLSSREAASKAELQALADHIQAKYTDTDVEDIHADKWSSNEELKSK